METDVIVIGYGSAGAVAAMTTHDSGLQVVVLEKQAQPNHLTTSFMAGGVIICPNDIEGAFRYMEALYKVTDNLFWTDSDILRIWAHYSAQNKEWLRNIGAAVSLYQHGGEHTIPGMEAIDIYKVRGRGPGLMRLLYNQIEKRKIKVYYETRVIHLLVNLKGEVTGIRAQQPRENSREINIRARRGVILATGGFEFDEEAKLQYLRAYPSYFGGSPASTGDGVRLGLEVGAQLWHMNCCSGRLVMKFPELPMAFAPTLGGKNWNAHSSVLHAGSAENSGPAEKPTTSAGYIIVDRAGKRFTSENYKNHTLYYEIGLYDSQKLLYPRIPSYWIFDQRRMDSGSIVWHGSGPAGPARIYKWSKDNSVELERGWIKKADTPKELAKMLGLDGLTLTETIKNYNRYCRNGQDPEFNRPPGTLIELATPPYYAVELWPGGPNTQGGPRRNSRAGVLRADGTEIPRLYSAGELGSIYGMLYPAAGGNLAECIAFGRIAGEKASENRPLR